mmetsp:Transcript_18139/g.39547  ORF Transcript_18139/g.39547 Transcript_18139/m.39547 type:complete len:163 (+) Transcript_18139:481-969(+)|eukprot:CAMPEP_0168185930 /NCGR_PEP_ID=MMETSP0139_2-20121125/14127_1 /TAXON_ID=44445 /ORGANISM="Pseudo-nitzschia australis, Strain 10249 10 AB" /LENGTH=162 /DNA_ID=CAMNT_0008107835 /DNA_START=401 /DNA_END=889 /DNA_ORIENTATION=+
MWTKIHLKRFLRWILTTLLAIVFPFATIHNPDGSQKQQKSYGKVPVASASNDDLESDNDEEDVDEKSKDSNKVKETDDSNVDVNVDVNIDVDTVIAGLDQGNMTFMDTFNKQLRDDEVCEKTQEGNVAYDFESSKNRVEEGSQDPCNNILRKAAIIHKTRMR